MAAAAAPWLILLSLLLLLGRPPPSLAQSRPRELTSFSAADLPWRPSDGRTLLSPNRTFAAGFRPTAAAPSLYLFSVWVLLAADTAAVWSFAPHRPLPPSAALSVSSLGVLSIGNATISTGGGGSNSSRLLLRDDGSLVFGAWTSFASPTDTLLANQPVPSNGTTLRSASGRYRLVNATALVYAANGTYWTSGDPITNLTSSGTVQQATSAGYVTSDVGDAALRRLTLGDDGNLRVYSLNATSGLWKVVWRAVQEPCTISGTCPPWSVCVPADTAAVATACACLPGFKNSTGGGGCVRKAPLSPRGGGDKFLPLDFVKFPAAYDAATLDIAQCESRCARNSSCIAFSYVFDGSRSCMQYAGRPDDAYWSPATETTTFLRVASTETDASNFTAMESRVETVCPSRIVLPLPPDESSTTARNAAIIGALFALELLIGAASFAAFLRRYSKYRDMARTFAAGIGGGGGGGPRRFTYAELKAATGEFGRVVGRGGFGVVYKGELKDGRAVAVKRLTARSVGRSEEDFWAEVTIIARMHHLNLVRMWGFCAEKDQRMLVYEYIPNGSLAKYLCGRPPAVAGSSDGGGGGETPPVLDWNIRYRIAVGVARAIAYLHEECLEWVLHCDIKPENILLDDDFCPKVSDFGLSKLATKEDVLAMSRIRGTPGYMAPEWLSTTQPITAKADVYSFGMVLLDIVVGTRDRRAEAEAEVSEERSEEWSMVGWAFEKVFVERRVEEVVDPRVAERYEEREHGGMVERMVKTAMWCLQERPEKRPSMGKVAKMLEGTVEILEPERPAIYS